MKTEDPRRHPKHKERGRTRYHYTVDDIALAKGYTVAQVYEAVKTRKVDLHSLLSVVGFLSSG